MASNWKMVAVTPEMKDKLADLLQGEGKRKDYYSEMLERFGRVIKALNRCFGTIPQGELLNSVFAEFQVNLKENDLEFFKKVLEVF